MRGVNEEEQGMEGSARAVRGVVGVATQPRRDQDRSDTMARTTRPNILRVDSVSLSPPTIPGAPHSLSKRALAMVNFMDLWRLCLHSDM